MINYLIIQLLIYIESCTNPISIFIIRYIWREYVFPNKLVSQILSFSFITDNAVTAFEHFHAMKNLR